MKRLLKKWGIAFLALTSTFPVQASALEDGRKVLASEWVQIESEGQLEWQNDRRYQELLNAGDISLNFGPNGMIDLIEMMEDNEDESKDAGKHSIDYRLSGKVNFSKDQAAIQLDYTEDGKRQHCELYIINDYIYCNRDYWLQQDTQEPQKQTDNKYITLPLYTSYKLEYLLNADTIFFNDNVEMLKNIFEVDLPIKEEGHCYTLEVDDKQLGDFVENQLDKIVKDREQVIKRIEKRYGECLSEEDSALIEEIVDYMDKVQMIKRLGYVINGISYGTDLKIVMDCNEEREMKLTMEGKLAYLKDQYLSGQVKIKITPLASYKVEIPKGA